MSASSTAQPHTNRHRGRLITVIALERAIGATFLIAVGVLLLTHLHTHWGHDISSVAARLGFNPGSNEVQKLIAKSRSISTTRYAIYGSIAVAFGLLEGAEGYGLWNRHRWGEYLTIFATSLLFIPEIWELVTKPSAVKGAALTLNAVIVTYLIVKVRRSAPQERNT